jgi:transcriptional regulator with XRE-family HTH domain
MSIDKQAKNNSAIISLIMSERIERHLTQREMAIVIGKSFQAIARWEASIGAPDTDTLITMKHEAKESWAREMAARCLHIRYPEEFSDITKD